MCCACRRCRPSAPPFGRRRVVILSNLGTGLDYVLMALAPNLVWLFLGRVISGITAASVSTAFAYIADVLPPEKRAAGFGRLGVAFGLGFVLGPALGGLLGEVDPRLPFWVAGGLSLANALYGWWVLPESLPPEKRGAFRWKRANPIGALAALRGRPGLPELAAVQFLAQLAHVALPSVTVLYAGHRYGLSEAELGLMLAGVGACSALVQGVLVGPAVRRFGERRAMLFGLGAGAAGFAGYGLAPSATWFLLAIPLMALWGIGGPAIQALMSRRVPPDEQGRLQGASSSLQGFAGLLGPGLFSTALALAIGDWSWLGLPGLPMLVASALMVAAVVLGWWVTRRDAAAFAAR
jgi:MFS transporter, DHA1 family, tetracycline resistance protein